MTVTRTIELKDVTPQELGQLFCDMYDNEQAAFFNEVGRITSSWKGSGWCMQASNIVRSLDLDEGGKRVLEQLADHVVIVREDA